MPERSAPFCAEVSLENAESLAATASRVDHWILVEYRGLWGHDALAASGLSNEVKAHLLEQRDARRNTKLLFLRRPHRRDHPSLAVFWGSSARRAARMLYHAEIEAYDELLDLDLTAPGGELLGHPLLIVCTHGKHDRCCARYGRPLYKALEEQAEDGVGLAVVARRRRPLCRERRRPARGAVLRPGRAGSRLVAARRVPRRPDRRSTTTGVARPTPSRSRPRRSRSGG